MIFLARFVEMGRDTVRRGNDLFVGFSKPTLNLRNLRNLHDVHDLRGVGALA